MSSPVYLGIGIMSPDTWSWMCPRDTYALYAMYMEMSPCYWVMDVSHGSCYLFMHMLLSHEHAPRYLFIDGYDLRLLFIDGYDLLLPVHRWI